MLIGIVVGLLYTIFGFSGDIGIPPTLSPTLGPLTNGMIIIKNYHIHHWVIYMVLLIPSFIFELHEVFWFSCVMTMHGLSYTDRFDFHEH